jgi:hypothetical protein
MVEASGYQYAYGSVVTDVVWQPGVDLGTIVYGNQNVQLIIPVLIAIYFVWRRCCHFKPHTEIQTQTKGTNPTDTDDEHDKDNGNILAPVCDSSIMLEQAATNFVPTATAPDWPLESLYVDKQYWWAEQGHLVHNTEKCALSKGAKIVYTNSQPPLHRQKCSSCF